MSAYSKGKLLKGETIVWTDIAAAVPVLLLSAASFIMLMLDIFIPAMKTQQYLIYPVIIRISELIGIVCFGICFSEKEAGRKDLPGRTAVLFSLFYLCIIISTFTNGISGNVIFGVPYRYIGIFDLILYCVVYMYCSSRIGAEKVRMTALAMIPIAADFIATAFLLHTYVSHISAFLGKREPAAIFFHGNHYGYFLTVAIAVSAGMILYFDGKVRVFASASMALNAYALTVNRTMGAFLAVVFTMTLMCVWASVRRERDARNAFMPLIFFLLIILLSALINSSFRMSMINMVMEILGIAGGDNNMYAGNGRWGIWQFTMDFIKERPLFGYGCEGINEMLYDLTFTHSPHNEPLTYAAFFGIPAALLYVAGVISAIISGLNGRNKSASCRIAAFAALGYFISSLFGVAMFYTAPFLFVMMGMACSDYSSWK